MEETGSILTIIFTSHASVFVDGLVSCIPFAAFVSTQPASDPTSKVKQPSQPANQPTSQLTSQPTNQPTSQPTMNQFILTSVLLALLVLGARCDDQMKDKILCVIETQLSTDRCKDVARNGAVTGGDPKSACASLQTFKEGLSIFGCSDADYDILEAMVCFNKDIACDWMF
ncbi:hypothetical protein BgiBS90_026683 [Biomphalaria glabrata]|nr:hypothetical protein BgiBS90_026683 [Biomphalaria glabrata]